MDYDKLRGAIYTKYKTQKACAEGMGWQKQKLHNILTGKQIPNVHEIKQIAEALKLTDKEFHDIFLPWRSTEM